MYYIVMQPISERNRIICKHSKSLKMLKDTIYTLADVNGDLEACKDTLLGVVSAKDKIIAGLRLIIKDMGHKDCIDLTEVVDD